ncbi:MAG: PKD domain-containing protein [Methanocalculus sp.]|uniref:PKD domain-containing protein n=1 Tax=Methanocalculus sp. TaxID=2004547 RepID=UPI002725A55E|nr:PKD domain-containing protein [Methanocalculus sp.]MDO9540307.1 PKD domain-containing protein [Methanocalculus sp.]
MRSILLGFLSLFFICSVASGVNVMIASDTMTGVAPGTITFTGSVSGNEGEATEWSWQFQKVGDPSGTTALLGSGKRVSITFDRHGTWRATLYTMVDGRSFQSNPYEVMIYDSEAVPNPDFTATPQTGTSPLTVTFTDRSSNMPTSWHWSFGDGAIGTGPKVTHTYTDPGSYSITLRVVNPAGSYVKTWSDFITVTTPPVAAFSVGKTSGEPPCTITFTDQSTGDIVRWNWVFGDGATSTLRHPTHTYTKSGVYSVGLTVQNAYGAVTQTKDNLIIIDKSPKTDFSADVQKGGAPLAVQFHDISGGHPNQWKWDFGDGKSSLVQNPQHTYLHPGTFKVSLTVSGSDIAGSLTRTGYITVLTPPKAGFDADRTFGSAPLTIRFSDRSTGDPDIWIWEFGDGSSSNVRHPSHTYTREGIYTVSLTIRNEYGYDLFERVNYVTVMKETPAPVVMREINVTNSSIEEPLYQAPELHFTPDIPFINPKDAVIEYIHLIRALIGK